MFLKNDIIVATIKDVTMRSFKVAGLSGQYVLDPTAVVGWTDGTAVRRDATPRMKASGDFSETAVMSSRVISFSGTAIASSAHELMVLRDKLIGVLGDGQYAEISVETSAGVRYSTVGLEGTPSWTIQTDTAAVWKIDMYAPDPYLYGPVNSVQSGANSVRGGLQYPLRYRLDYHPLSPDTAQVISNNGNVDSFPVFKVTGDYLSGFLITDNLGNYVQYDGMVTFQSPVIIDMRKGAALQNGVDKSVLISRRDWFTIPAGKSLQPIFTPSQAGSGWCDIIYRDTWI